MGLNQVLKEYSYVYEFLIPSNHFFSFQAVILSMNKVKNILKGSLDSIPPPSPSMKIQIMCGKVCLIQKFVDITQQ